MSLLRCFVASVVLACSVAAQKEVSYAPLSDSTAPGAATLYGLCVASGGDVDGDTINDFAVGAPGVNMEDGRVYVYSGATGAILYGGPIGPVPPAGITGGHYQFGSSVNMSRDFNADGRAEIIVGAMQNSGFTNRKGFVELIDGATGTPLASWAGAIQDLLGSAVAAGDINGDGNPDVVAGARNANSFTGQVVAWSGVAPFAQILMHASPSPTAFTGYGQSVACANVNGDAFDDIIVGADESGNPTPIGAGFVEVVLGPAGAQASYGLLAGTLLGDHFGVSVANAGDVAGDADGFDDFIVGAPQYNAGEKIGYALVYDGQTGAVLRTLVGEQPKDYFGASVGGGIDFNGDGTTDFLVGAVQDQPQGSRGYVRVHSGTPGLAPPFLYRREGDKAGTPNAGTGLGFGRSVAAMGHTTAFTTESFVGTSAVYAGVGHVEVITGRNLLLTGVPDSVSTGEIVSILVAQLPTNSPLLLLAGLPPAPTAIHPVLGVPLLLQSLLVAAMQPNESLLLSGTAPPGLAGLSILVQYAAKPAGGGNIRVTDIQTINF